MLRDRQTRRPENVLLVTSTVGGSRCRVFAPPALRFAVLLILCVTVVEPAARRRTGYGHGGKVAPPASPPRYHSQRQINGQLETWQVARCRQHDHYVACFLCGRIVQSREVYYGCCNMNPIVLQFCDRLLAWLLLTRECHSQCIRGGPKICILCTPYNLTKYWPIFKLYFSVRIRRKFVIILSLMSPLHLKGVTKLPCEMPVS